MFKVHRSFDLSTGVKSNSIAVLHRDKLLAVTYHKTVVVERKGKTITLRDGGWKTISTRHVINNTLRQMGLRMHLESKLVRTTGVKPDGTKVKIKERVLVLNDMDNNVLLPFVNGMKVSL